MAVNEQSAPFSAEAEMGVLGAVLLNPASYPALAVSVQGDDFFLLRHQYIWQAFEQIREQAQEIDYLTVVEHLRAAGHLDEIGGPAYITQLVNSTPTATHGPVYAGMVSGLAVRRRMLIAADEIRRLALDEVRSVEASLESARETLMEVIWRGNEETGATLEEVISRQYDKMEQVQHSQQRVMGISTGLTDLDLQIDGLQPGRFYVVGARPGMGKSSLLMKFVLAAAQQKCIAMPERFNKVAYFLTEMNKDEVGWRVSASESQLNSRKLRNASSLSPHQTQRYVEAVNRLGISGIGKRVWMDDRAAPNWKYILGKAAIAKQILGGLDLIVVDGLYLMSASGRGNRNEAVTEISQGLKNIARTYNVPLVASHQLNRKCEEREDKRPVLSDLRDSGSVEQDADVIIFVYRDVVYNQFTEFPNEAQLITAKNRDGITGIVSTYFEPATTSFMNGAARRVDLSGLDDLEGPRPPARETPAGRAPGSFSSQTGGADHG